MSSILLLAIEVFAKIPSMLEKGIDAWDLFTATKKVVEEHKVVGDPEWEKLEATIAGLQPRVRDTSGDVRA